MGCGRDWNAREEEGMAHTLRNPRLWSVRCQEPMANCSASEAGRRNGLHSRQRQRLVLSTCCLV
jgi:hypothetical protein